MAMEQEAQGTPSAPAGRRRVPGRAGVTPLAAVMAAALLALAPALSWAQYRVTGVTITSNPPASGFYTEADTITVQVRFTGAGGVRRSFGGSGGSIGLDIGGVNRSATVGPAPSAPGRSFTHDLTYRVQAGDRDLDGISVRANSLGGDWDCGSTCAPSLSHNAVASTQKVLATPARPAGFRAVGGAGSARLTWTRDTGAHSSRYYEYNYRPDGGTYGSWSRAGGQSASSFTVTGLSAGEYDFQLRAVNQTGSGRAAGRVNIRVTAGTGGGGGTPSGPSTPSEPARVVVDPASLTVVEGRNATYSVDLSARPTGEVTVAIASSAAAAVTVAPAELTFTIGNYDTPQRVTVTAQQDDDMADGAATLRHTASGGGVTATGPTVSVTVTDDDAEGVTVPEELMFAAGAEVPAQIYIAGMAITEITLPAAAGGTPPLRYAVTPALPEGLSFNAETRVLSGTPTEAAERTEYTLTVTDAQNSVAELSFSITVQAAPVTVPQNVVKARGAALGNVLASFGGAIAADAVEVIGDRFTAVGPLLKLSAPPPGGAMAAGSAFAAPAPGGFALWGHGALSGFNTATEDGSVLSGYVGADWRWTPDFLIGGALAFSGAGDVNYYSAGAKGKATVNLAAVLPYAHYTPLPGLGVWGLAGIGGGSAAVTPDGGDKKAIITGMFMSLGAVGARYELLGFPGGSAAVKADGHLAWLSTGAKDGLEVANAMPGRVRLLVEGRYRWQFLEQSWLLPVVEAGGRYDGALGAEFGGGIAYRHTGLGLGAEVRGRYLLAAGQEWGASAEFSYTPGDSGWTFALIPEWGLPQSGAVELWAGNGAPDATPALAAGPAPARLRLQAGYRGAESFSLNLAATREEQPAAPVYGLLINGTLHM